MSAREREKQFSSTAVGLVIGSLAGLGIRWLVLPYVPVQLLGDLVQLLTTLTVSFAYLLICDRVIGNRHPSPPSSSTTVQRRSSRAFSNNEIRPASVQFSSSSSSSSEGVRREGSGLAPLALKNSLSIPRDLNLKGDLSIRKIDDMIWAVNGLVPEAPDEIPEHFLAACNGNRAKAAKRWAVTRQWRIDHHVNQILSQPNTTIEMIRRFYPHYLHGRGLKGELILYEKAGKMDMSGLKAKGYTAADVARHSTFMQEFMWNVLAKEPGARMITVMDMAGMALRRVTSSDTAELIKATSEVLNTHYPERVSLIMVVNVPGWMGSAWSIVATILPASLREKVKVTSKLSDLNELIDPHSIPTEYGGLDDRRLGEAVEERMLVELVSAVREVRTPLTLGGVARAGVGGTPASISTSANEGSSFGGDARGAAKKLSSIWIGPCNTQHVPLTIDPTIPKRSCVPWSAPKMFSRSAKPSNMKKTAAAADNKNSNNTRKPPLSNHRGGRKCKTLPRGFTLSTAVAAVAALQQADDVVMMDGEGVDSNSNVTTPSSVSTIGISMGSTPVLL